MAQGKKSFIAYSDWKNIFDELPNEEAGLLIKHIFSYVNDENPHTENILIRAVFANIKTTLKRDLDKWETQLEQRSKAGRASAESRKTKFNEINERSTVVESRARNSTVSVSVNDSVSVSDNVFEKHFDHINNFFSIQYEFQSDDFKSRYEPKKYLSFQIIIKNINEVFPELRAKFQKCMGIGDWMKHLDGLGYMKIKPAIETMLGYKIEPTANMALKIKQFMADQKPSK